MDLIDVDTLVYDSVVVLVEVAAVDEKEFLFIIYGPIDAHHQLVRAKVAEKPALLVSPESKMLRNPLTCSWLSSTAPCTSVPGHGLWSEVGSSSL